MVVKNQAKTAVCLVDTRRDVLLDQLIILRPVSLANNGRNLDQKLKPKWNERFLDYHTIILD